MSLSVLAQQVLSLIYTVYKRKCVKCTSMLFTYISCPEAKTGWALSLALSELGCCRDPGDQVDKGTTLSAAGPHLTFPLGSPAVLHPLSAVFQWKKNKEIFYYLAIPYSQVAENPILRDHWNLFYNHGAMERNVNEGWLLADELAATCTARGVASNNTLQASICLCCPLLYSWERPTDGRKDSVTLSTAPHTGDTLVNYKHK